MFGRMLILSKNRVPRLKKSWENVWINKVKQFPYTSFQSLYMPLWIITQNQGQSVQHFSKLVLLTQNFIEKAQGLVESN